MSVDLYPINEDVFLAKYTEQKMPDLDINKHEIVLIIDISGSMYSYTELYTHYIPNFINSLGLDKDKKMHILLFGSELYFAYDNIDILQKVTPNGGTAAELPAMYLTSSKILDKAKKYKMIFFTDGEFNDQHAALQHWSNTADYIKKNRIQCETYAFRIERSAEVIGLLPFLNMSSEKNSSLQLFDISRKDFRTTNFPKLGMKSYTDTKFAAPIAVEYPLRTLSNTIRLSDGDFFIVDLTRIDVPGEPGMPKPASASLFPNNLEVNNKPCNISILCQYLRSWLTKLTVEKIIDSKLDINAIVRWVLRTKKYIESNSRTNITSYAYLKNLRDRSSEIVNIIEHLKMLNSSSRIKTLNAQQQASYLRDVTDTKLGKSTSRRTLRYDVNKDIANTIRNEFKTLKTVIGEIDHIDDASHQSSFVSLETTVSALRSIACELTNEEIDQLEIEDLVGLLHIVGIGVNAPIGDFPDPMVYHVEKVTFAFVSLVDILQSEINGQELRAPGINVKLNNVIPIFEDVDLFKFCNKYLKISMEILSGIGMRRLLAFIPQTRNYTTLSGLWVIINEEPQKWSYDLTKIILPQLEIMFEGGFDYVTNDLITPSDLVDDLKRQIYIGNNGITNMILPLYKLYTDPKFESKRSFLPAIYRALYSFELATIARKTNRYMIQQNGKYDYFANCLITNLYVSNAWEFNKEYIDGLLNKRTFIKNLFLIEVALSTTFEEFKNFKLTDDCVQERLGIDYDFKSFEYYTLVQAFLHKNRSERCEDLEETDPIYNVVRKKERAIVADLDTHRAAHNYIQTIVDHKYDLVQKEIFKQKFEKDLIAEREKYIKLLVGLPYADFLVEYSNGFKVQDNTIHINTLDENFSTLFNDFCRDTPDMIKKDMAEKTVFFIKGGDETHVFNLGKMSTFLIKKSRKFIPQDVYEDLRKDIKIYKYRNSPENRHSHSNDKPSFFAFGFISYEEYERSVTEVELAEYLSVHTNCCVPFSRSRRSQ